MYLLEPRLAPARCKLAERQLHDEEAEAVAHVVAHLGREDRRVQRDLPPRARDRRNLRGKLQRFRR